ncbi:MAG: AAA family ATPase [Gammaproteobacteria bacterium]|nr:AAA family ATPase [Gammaproteobacteria bacterium]
MNQYVSSGLDATPDAEARRTAIDPTRSFLVQAPAGSGKTALLVKRYVCLLAAVNEPEEILAITFTRKAAQEMRSRVITELTKADKSEAALEVMQRSQARKWNLIANPQRMRIQTIDSFQSGLVERLPFQSRLSLEYEMTSNPKTLYEEAISNTLERIASQREQFGDEIAAMLAAFDNRVHTFTDMLVMMLERRIQWLEHVAVVARGELDASQKNQIVDLLERARNEFCDARKRAFRGAVSAEWCDDAYKLVQAAKPDTFLGMQDPSDWTFLAECFITKGSRPNLRQRLTKGFETITEDEALKQMWKELAESIPESVTPQDFQKIQFLPPQKLSDSHRATLSNYALTLIACSQELQKLFDERRVVDFTEKSVAAMRALKVDDAPTQLAYALDYRIKHILVDEYQDTSIAQNEFFNTLMDGWEPDDGNTFFAVGDPMQSIYMFRDADLSNFLNADTGGIRNRHVEKLWLTSNFRSRPHLVQWCNTLFRGVLGSSDDAEVGRVAFAKSDEILDPDPHSTHGLVWVDYPNRDREAALVAEKVEELRDAKAKETDTIAILFRTRNGIEPFFEALRSRNISWRGIEMEKLVDVPIVRDLYSLACALVNPDDKQAWFELLLCPLVGIELADIEILSTQDRGIDMVLGPSLDGLSVNAQTILGRIRGPILSAMQSQHRSLRSRLERAWYQLGGANAYQRESDVHSTNAVHDNAQHFLNELERTGDASFDKVTLFNHLAEIYATENNPDADVEVLTIHKAKGLEFDHVIVPALSQFGQKQTKKPLYAELTPHGVILATHNVADPDPMLDVLYKREQMRAEHEMARLLYVAATRAKQTLWFYGTADKEKKKLDSRTFFSLIDSQVNRDEWLFDEVEEEERTELADGQIWRRIDPHFRFEAPSSLPPFPVDALIAPRSPTASFKDMQSELSTPLAIGLIVHADLQRMVLMESMELPDSARVEMWRNQLRMQGFDVRAIGEMLERVQAQLTQVVASPIGQWLLDPTHEESATEIAYSTFNGNGSKISIVDRTFVDDGVRWIVDYKTTRIPDDRDVSLDLKALEHQSQLIGYARLFELQEDRPIKAAIFFTDTADLVEVDVSQAARDALENEARGTSSAIDQDATFKPIDELA